MSNDIKYYIDKGNNSIDNERKQKIIIFGNKDRLNKMMSKDYYEYFIDITFKIEPKCYRPYKLMTNAIIDNKENRAILIGFVFFYLYGLYIIHKNIQIFK